MNLTFKKKSFFFKLSSKVDNSNTTYKYKSGWIIKLKNMEKGVGFGEEIGRAHVRTPVTEKSRMPSSA